MLIVASLSAMLLHGVHLGLASKKGLPLGFVSSSFQLNSMAYLFRREFTTLNKKYIVSFVAIFLFALVSGPSSAITMIPRLQFWPIENWVYKGSVHFSVYIAASKENLFPEILTSEHVPVACLQANASIIKSCPAFGMRHWMMYNNLIAQNSNGFAPTFNRTIQEGWIRYMNGQSPIAYVGMRGVYMTSTLSNFLGNVLLANEAALYDYSSNAQVAFGVEGGEGTIQRKYSSSELAARYDMTLRSGGKPITARKPLVSVECIGHLAGTKMLPLPHDRMTWNVPASDYTDLIVDTKSTIVNSSLIDIAQFGDIKPSLGVFFSAPETKGGENSSLYTCTIDARWMETRAFSDASSGARAIFDFNPSPTQQAVSEGVKRIFSNPPMYMSSTWTKALTVPWIDSILAPTPSSRTIFDVIGQGCLDANSYINDTFRGKSFEDGLPHRMLTNPMDMLQCLQLGLAVTIAEAASRVQDLLPTYFVAEGHNLQVSSENSPTPDRNPFQVSDIYGSMPQYVGKNDGRIHGLSMQDFRDPERFTEIFISGARWGYGYGFHDSILIYFGVVVLLVHVLLSLVYVAWILWMGDYLDAGWDTIGGLVAMAMRSGTGEEREVEDEKTKWKGRLAVRETKEEGSSSVLDSGTADVLVLRKVRLDGENGEDVDGFNEDESTRRHGEFVLHGDARDGISGGLHVR